MEAKLGAKRIELEAVVIRADGSQEDLGTIASWDRNPVRRFWDSLRKRGKIAIHPNSE